MTLIKKQINQYVLIQEDAYNAIIVVKWDILQGAVQKREIKDLLHGVAVEVGIVLMGTTSREIDTTNHQIDSTDPHIADRTAIINVNQIDFDHQIDMVHRQCVNGIKTIDHHHVTFVIILIIIEIITNLIIMSPGDTNLTQIIGIIMTTGETTLTERKMIKAREDHQVVHRLTQRDLNSESAKMIAEMKH